MKIRYGFVSNSSSSSFIVMVNPEECTLEYIRSKVDTFPDAPVTEGTTKRIAEMLHRDITAALSGEDDEDRDMNQVFDTFGLYDSWDETWAEIFEAFTNTVTTKEEDRFVDIWAAKLLDLRKQCMDDMLSRTMSLSEGKTPITLSYSDNDGQFFSFLEHSGIVEWVFPEAIKNENH